MIPANTPDRKFFVVVTLMREQGATGVQTHIAMAADVLRRDGADVTILTPFSGKSLSRTPVFALRYLFKYISGPLEIFWYRYGHALYLKRAFRAHLRRHKVDLVYAHCPLSAQVAMQLVQDDNIPVVLAVHFNGSQAFEWEQRGKIRKNDWLFRQIIALEDRVLPAADQLIFVSGYMLQTIRARNSRLDVSRTRVVPNFIAAPQSESTHKDWDLITVGSLEPRKNQQFTLHVVAELKKRGLDVSLAVVGDGEDLRNLQRLAENLEIARLVTFHGAVKNPFPLIQRAKLFVHSALLENLPLVLVEAMAAGLPIVAAPVGGIPELLKEQRNGCFWSLDNTMKGADTIEGLLMDEALRSRMSEQAKLDYQANYSFGSAGQALREALHQAGRS